MEVLKALAYAHSLDILSSLDGAEGHAEWNGEGGKRFTDIEDELSLNPNIVNMRLKDLRMASLVEKEGNGYKATDKGDRALEIAKELEKL